MNERPSIHYAGGWYLWRGSYEHRRLPSDAGFDWHAPTKTWRTRNPFAARRLMEYADRETQLEILATMDAVSREVAAKAGATP